MVKLRRPPLPNIHCPYLPLNYNFELPKLISTIKKLKCKKVCLQLPDGLLKYSTILSDCIWEHTRADTIILADVVYGACCIDDKAVEALGGDLLVHFGHSCLVPVNECRVRVLYIFVDIVFDTDNLISTIDEIVKEYYNLNNKDCSIQNVENIEKQLEMHNYNDLCIMGTIQFNSIIHMINQKLNLDIPRISPLSRGEVLGCTAPKIKESLCIFISDGRFHLEALMIQNPNTTFYRYCPFNKKAYREKYDLPLMLKNRKESVMKLWGGTNIGVILGTLGRQGNPLILENIIRKLEQRGKKVFIFQYEEIKRLEHDFIDGYVQICCPRLSIDWDGEFRKPVINSFELFWDRSSEYLMDFY